MDLYNEISKTVPDHLRASDKLIFLNPVIGSDGDTYEQEDLRFYVRYTGETPHHETAMRLSQTDIRNLEVEREIQVLLEKYPELIKQQYRSDDSYKNSFRLVKYCIESGDFHPLFKIKEFDLADMIERGIFVQLISEETQIPNDCLRYIFENSLDLDCSELGQRRKTPGYLIFKHGTSDIFRAYLRINGNSRVLRKANYYLDLVIKYRSEGDLKHLCENFNLDWNDGSKKSGTTPFMRLITLFWNSERVDFKFSESFIDYFLDTYGKTLDWNVRNKKGNCALSILFDNSKIGWSYTTKFIKCFDPTKPPDFMAPYKNKKTTILHRALNRCTYISVSFMKILREYMIDLSTPVQGITPFSLLCKWAKASVIRCAYQYFQPKLDLHALKTLRDRSGGDENLSKEACQKLMSTMIQDWFCFDRIVQIDDHTITVILHQRDINA